MNEKVNWKQKLTSRVFWLCIAAFLASVSSGIAAIGNGNDTIGTVGIVCGVVAAGIYAAAEKATDIARIKSDTKLTTMTQNVTATSDDMYTVATVLSPAQPSQTNMEDGE